MDVPLSSTASKPLINTLEQWVRPEESAVINPVGDNIVQVRVKKESYVCPICLKLTITLPEHLFVNFDHFKQSNLELHH